MKGMLVPPYLFITRICYLQQVGRNYKASRRYIGGNSMSGGR